MKSVREKDDYFLWAWWAWEPIYAIRRSGRMAGGVKLGNEKLEAWYKALHSEETVRKIAAAGINCAVTHFYKGFGLDFEKTEMERSSAFVKLCHKHGIKVFAYIQYGSIFHEVFFKEKPEAANWIQLDDAGKPNLWCGDYRRYMPCASSAEYLDYLEGIIKRAVTHAGFDGLHFDNFYSLPCHCGKCRLEFRRYLEGKCDAVSEFGIPDFGSVNPPPGQMLPGDDFDDPLLREWVKFRQEKMNSVMDRLSGYAMSLKKDIMLLYNPGFIRGLLNQGALRSTEISQIGPRAQFIWAESGNFPGIRNNCLIHQAHYFKTADAAAYKALSTTWLHSDEGSGLSDSPAKVKLNIAESAAFGAMPGSNWALRAAPDGNTLFDENPQMAEAMKSYFAFIKKHIDIFSGSRSIAPLAFYINRPSLFYNYRRTCATLMAAEQILLQYRIPFDIVISEIGNIDKYGMIILPELISVSSAEAGLFSAYVKNGGKLFLCGVCGEKDENNCDRETFPGKFLKNRNIFRYLPQGDWLKNIGGNNYLTYISLPGDAGGFAQSVKNALGRKMPFVIKTVKNTLVAEIRETLSGDIALHLINYDNIPETGDLKIEIDKSALPVQDAAEFLDADSKKTQMLKAVPSKHLIVFNIPGFQTYGILLLKNKNEREKNG